MARPGYGLDMTITPSDALSDPEGSIDRGGSPGFIEWTQGFDEWSNQFETILDSYRGFSARPQDPNLELAMSLADGLDIQVTNFGPMVEFHLKGEVDVASSGYLRETINGQIGRAGNPLVVLDLSELTFIDSTGLGILVAAYRRARAVGSDLVLQHPKPNIAKVFAISGLDRVLTIADDPE